MKRRRRAQSTKKGDPHTAPAVKLQRLPAELAAQLASMVKRPHVDTKPTDDKDFYLFVVQWPSGDAVQYYLKLCSNTNWLRSYARHRHLPLRHGDFDSLITIGDFIGNRESDWFGHEPSLTYYPPEKVMDIRGSSYEGDIGVTTFSVETSHQIMEHLRRITIEAHPEWSPEETCGCGRDEDV